MPEIIYEEDSEKTRFIQIFGNIVSKSEVIDVVSSNWYSLVILFRDDVRIHFKEIRAEFT